MLVAVGQVALVVAFMVSGYASAMSFLGGRLKAPHFVSSARYGLYTTPLLLLIVTLTLMYAFVTHDFSVQYVVENSSHAMPPVYTWVAFYAGNAGSLLYLAFAFSIIVVIAGVTTSRHLPSLAPYASGIMALLLTFFLGVLVFLANPLDRLPVPLTDGQGINPLLVHFGMFIHPPVQMLGLVSVAIPFSIALGVLLSGEAGRDEWVDQGRRWAMISWLILTIGLLLGAWWAYTILGWGGYWAWDPVENAAFMPWLAMTAFVHSIMVQKRRGMFRMWNMTLIVIAFTFAQLGMFINRGGPVPSVHSFAESTMGWLFLAAMGFTLVASVAVFLWRLDTMKSRSILESFLSRESAFLAQNVLFLLIAFITLWGTIYPIFTDVAQEMTVTVGEPFFNLVNGPLMLILIFLMAVGPLLPWRRASFDTVGRLLRLPLAMGLVVGVALLVLGLREIPALVAFGVCGMALTGMMHEWVRGSRVRHARGEAYPEAFIRLLLANRPRYGGYIIHIAIVMLAVGVTASSFYSVQRDLLMKPGETSSLGDYTFTYVSLQETVYEDRVEEEALLSVQKGNGSPRMMRPFRAFYPRLRIASTRGAIRSTPLEDFYVVPSTFREDGQAVFRILINPMVWWMWASGPLLFFGMLLAVSPGRRQAKETLPLPLSPRPSRL